MLFKTFFIHRVRGTSGSDSVIGSFRTGVSNMEASVLLQNYANLFDHAKEHCEELRQDLRKVARELGACRVEYFLSVDDVHGEKFTVEVENRKEVSIGFFEVNLGQQNVADAMKDYHTMFDFAIEHCPSLTADMEKAFQSCGGDVHREYYGFACDDIKSSRFMVEMTRDLNANLRACVVDYAIDSNSEVKVK